MIVLFHFTANLLSDSFVIIEIILRLPVPVGVFVLPIAEDGLQLCIDFPERVLARSLVFEIVGRSVMFWDLIDGKYRRNEKEDSSEKRFATLCNAYALAYIVLCYCMS